ncbi:MAG: DUF305 domain-containing protein [Mycobacterium sp.]
MKSYGAGLLVLIVTFLVGACGGAGSQPQAPRSTDQPAITGAPAGFNADDVAFANGMITSYGQTSELTALVPERSADSDLVALAAGIDVAQGPDLETMKVLLVQWNSNSDSGPSQGWQGNAVMGMVDDATKMHLNSSSGAEFDSLWLRSMIGHQQGAVEMAEAEIAHGTNVDAVATAKRFVGTYRAQIARMQQELRDR